MEYRIMTDRQQEKIDRQTLADAKYHDLGSVHQLDAGFDIREHDTPVVLPRDDQRDGKPLRIEAQDRKGKRVTITGDLAAVSRELVYHGYTVHGQRGKPRSGPGEPCVIKVRLTDDEKAGLISEHGSLAAAVRSLLK